MAHFNPTNLAATEFLLSSRSIMINFIRRGLSTRMNSAKLILTSLVLSTVFLLHGCAGAAKVENMTYSGESKEYLEDLRDNMSVASTTGGKKTNPAWTSEIGNEDFKAAVEMSLASEGLLSEDGIYSLSIELLEVDQPMFSIDTKVTTTVRYLITNSSNSFVVLDETITTPYTATMSEAFAAVKRLRLANEGSAKANIEAFLETLSQLEGTVRLSMLR